MCLNVNKIVIPSEKPIINPVANQAAKVASEIIQGTSETPVEQNSVNSLKDGKAITSINLNDNPPPTKAEELFTKILDGLPKIDADGGQDNKIFILKNKESNQLDKLIRGSLVDSGIKKNETGLLVVMVSNFLSYKDDKPDNTVNVDVNKNKGAKQLGLEFKKEIISYSCFLQA